MKIVRMGMETQEMDVLIVKEMQALLVQQREVHVSLFVEIY